MVSFDSVVICRRRILSTRSMLSATRARSCSSTAAALGRCSARSATLLLSLTLLSSRRTVIHLSLLACSTLIVRDVVICHSFASPLVVDWFIVVVVLGITGNDIPGMQQTREVAEAAQSDINEGVGGTDPGFDPDYDGRELASAIQGRVGAGRVNQADVMGSGGQPGRYLTCYRWEEDSDERQKEICARHSFSI